MFKRLKVVGVSALAFSVLVGLAVHYVEPQVAAAAQLQRQVQLPIATRIEPVVVAKVTLGDVVVQSGRFIKPATEAADPITPFWAEDDWIQNVTVYFLNRTNQAIVFAYVVFSFPETTAGQTRYAFPLTLGVIPPSASFGLDGKPFRQPPGAQPLMVRPHQTMAIHLGDYIDRIKARIEPVIPLAALRTMNVTPQNCFFEGGMQWNAGYRVFDPQTATWRRMDPNYFPGDIDGYWPGRPGWIDQ